MATSRLQLIGRSLGRARSRFDAPWPLWRTAFIIVAAAALLGLSPFVKMSLVVNGVVLGSFIALGAIGLTLVYGLLNFANMAHGDSMTLGAYVSLFIVTGVLAPLGIEGAGLGPFSFGYPLLIALPIAAAVVALAAILLDAAVYRRLRERGVNVVIISMASLGVAIAIRGLVQLLWGGEIQRFPRESRQAMQLPMDVRVPPDAIFILGATVLLALCVFLILTRTKLGKAMRATADNPDLALVSGIGTRRVVGLAWGLSASLAAVAGILLAVFQANFLPIMGWKFLIPLFAAVILGSIGSANGALLGALIIGVSMEVSTQWFNPSYKPAVAFAIMILMLFARPYGLFGSGRS